MNPEQREKWSEIDKRVLNSVHLEKFGADKTARACLLGTKEKMIIEVSPDLRYGAGAGKEELLRNGCKGYRGDNIQGKSLMKVRQALRDEWSGKMDFANFAEEWAFCIGGTRDGRSVWYGPATGEDMQSLYENFKQNAKWRVWIGAVHETMDRAADRPTLSGNDSELFYFMNGGRKTAQRWT